MQIELESVVFADDGCRVDLGEFQVGRCPSAGHAYISQSLGPICSLEERVKSQNFVARVVD